MRSPRYLFLFALIFAWVALGTIPAYAQYFGRNKVQYQTFDFQILPTEHFDIYYYAESEEKIHDVARMAERWYERHRRTFVRELRDRKPLIFYANDTDFQQTNVIGGFIGEGVGGVTESLKERVVMPLTGMYEETDHVLGHELVHSFQYDIGLDRRDTARFALGAMPLWLIEGTAEYLSVGREDSHTAMWLRDAALRDDLPTITQLTRDLRYFPYRYGQAYMAYIGGKYGDTAVTQLFRLGGRVGLDSAFVYALGITADSLSKEWIEEVRSVYLPLTEGRTPADEAGRLILGPETGGGNLNVAPSVSPDGRFVAYFSERDIFNINLFIADVETGQVVRRLRSFGLDPHFDSIRFINSSGSWAPDGSRFAFVTFAEGRNEINVLDPQTGRVTRRIAVEGVGAITNPAWSPDGDWIAFSGIRGGISNLYVLDVNTRRVRQLTDDRFSVLQPSWSPDGNTIAYTTDGGPDGTDFQALAFARKRIALVDVESGAQTIVRPFERADHMNPHFTSDGGSLLFISDHDGFRDIYRHDLGSAETFRVTSLQTGVSGITRFSPALTVARETGRTLFSVFSGSEYRVYALEANETVGEAVEALPPGVPTAGILPPIRALDEGLVGTYLASPEVGLPPQRQIAEAPIRSYSPRLRLDYIAPPTVGVSAGGPFGTQVGGGVGFFFSDMLGDQNLSIAAQASGTLQDVGGQATYLNMRRRWNVGATAAHIPILSGYAMQGTVQDDAGNFVPAVIQVRQRIFISQLAGVAIYPLTSTRRFEFQGGFLRYGFSLQEEQFLLYPNFVERRLIDRDDLVPDPFYFAQGLAAYVGDNSYFGFTSPVTGSRYRFQISPVIGSREGFTQMDDGYIAALGDFRRYFFMNPFTFAVRGLHIGNYGADGGDLFSELYLGYQYNPGFIRGYSFNNFRASEECTFVAGQRCPELDRLVGTRIATASMEFRVPLIGTEAFGLINFPFLPTEVALFADGGVAWRADSAPELRWDTDTTDRVPVFSAGVTTRMNLLGYMIMEIFYVVPFQRPERGPHFGLQLIPGW
jgi:hypothetical protein